MKNLFLLFWEFFKLGLFTFGGGYAMIPQLKDIVITKYHWISDDELLDVIAVAESTPGPIAINLATYIGYKKNKILVINKESIKKWFLCKNGLITA